MSEWVEMIGIALALGMGAFMASGVLVGRLLGSSGQISKNSLDASFTHSQSPCFSGAQDASLPDLVAQAKFFYQAPSMTIIDDEGLSLLQDNTEELLAAQAATLLQAARRCSGLFGLHDSSGWSGRPCPEFSIGEIRGKILDVGRSPLWLVTRGCKRTFHPDDLEVLEQAIRAWGSVECSTTELQQAA